MNSVKLIATLLPRASGHVDPELAAQCIEACLNCESVCTTCADACLAEPELSSLRRCIRANLDCAEVCATTMRIVSRFTEPDWTLVRDQLQTLLTACGGCASECERHADRHEHCQICAAACRRCAHIGNQILAQVPAAIGETRIAAAAL